MTHSGKPCPKTQVERRQVRSSEKPSDDLRDPKGAGMPLLPARRNGRNGRRRHTPGGCVPHRPVQSTQLTSPRHTHAHTRTRRAGSVPPTSVTGGNVWDQYPCTPGDTAACKLMTAEFKTTSCGPVTQVPSDTVSTGGLTRARHIKRPVFKPHTCQVDLSTFSPRYRQGN